jgi:phosphate transport system substrate-binding protein
LATPPEASDDVSKDLSRLIVKKLIEALKQGEAISQTAPLPQPTTVLKGAGATFPFPVYAKWFTNYRRENPAVQITYEPIGSEGGVRELLANSVDFGASDSPEAIHLLAPEDEERYLFVPSVIGAVVSVVNLPGLTSDIAFTPEALAGIYLGKVKKWNDPILTRANRGLRLPDLDIEVVHRADGSGTSYFWTDYLSKISPEWKAQVGTSLAPKWPVGLEANGNDGVSKLVKERAGSIGYVEFIYALQNHLTYGRVRNRDGKFVSASLESIAAAASHSMKISHDSKVSIVDAPGAGVYPISSFTWIIFPVRSANYAKRNALAGFLPPNWGISLSLRISRLKKGLLSPRFTNVLYHFRDFSSPRGSRKQRRLETALFECDGPSYGEPRQPRPVSLRESSLVAIIVAVQALPHS